MDWLLERSVGRGMNGTTFGQYSFTDLDYADDVSVLSEMFGLLVPVLESFHEEAGPLGLEVNWQKRCSRHWARLRMSHPPSGCVGRMFSVWMSLSWGSDPLFQQ